MLSALATLGYIRYQGERVKLLGPLLRAEHRLLDVGCSTGHFLHNIKDLVFAGERADYIVRERPELASRYFTVVDTADSQVAVVYLNGKLARVVKPGARVLFWRGAVAVTFPNATPLNTPFPLALAG